jgi:hypothetical protein
MGWHVNNHRPSILGDTLRANGSTPERTQGEIQAAVARGPQGIADFISRSKMGQTKFAEMIAPIPKRVTDGKNSFLVDDNPKSPTFGQKVGGAGFEMGTTPGERLTADTAAKRLAFEQGKFAYEKANPGFELKEAEDGSIVGVNKRTLQAFPVNIGGAAPSAASGVMPVSSGLPGARAGVSSVAPVAAPGAEPTAAARPLMGKGTAMTETQSNAAMFGGAMAQAQNVIKQLEKAGTVKNAVVPGVLTGLAQMVPFGVGENIGNVIQSTFNADPTGLVGPNAAQQKLAQAQLAFAIAYLRKTSGAAFGASEVANTIKEFFPLAGEGDKVIAQKAAARDRALEGMKISTNKEGRKFIESFSGGGGGGVPGASANDPLGLGVR